MATETKLWTLEEVHSLPDDGNTYELIRGELYVTPPAGETHETVAARLTRLLDPYVEAHRLGLVYRPKAVFRMGKDVQVEPDLMIRKPHPNPIGKDADWETAPLPVLVVEILSPTTRQRDFGVKRKVYIHEAGIPEYWIVDREDQTITVIARGQPDVTVADWLTWLPPGASEPLIVDVPRAFGVRGDR